MSQEGLIAERYQVLGVLGRGGMGVVYEARDTVLERRVAVKLLTSVEGLAEGGDAALRFQRELNALARIEHPGVVTLFDTGLHRGTPYLVMQVLDGMTLAELVARTGPLAPAVVAWTGLGMAGALDAAHGAGVLHRDIKPSNVGVTTEGRIVIQDFGLARLAGEAAITRTGALVGTPQFIAPETIRGALPGPAADLYGLGGCLYLAVTGELPLGATQDVGAIVERALGDGIPRLGERPPYPAELTALIDLLCRQDPTERPASARAVGESLAALAGEGRTLLADLMTGTVRQDVVDGVYALAAAAGAPEYEWDRADETGTIPNGSPTVWGARGDWPGPAALSDATRRIVLSSMTAQNAASRQREAVTLVLRGELQAAAQMLSAIVPVCVSSLGEDHPTTLAGKYWQAVCLARLGARGPAVELLAQVNRHVDRKRGGRGD
ncbi:serine/threonine-protein kinase [Streptomyces xanthochromogenes]|uniref:serine/threonine-protein kinase n=1 Tax=Streptomyces xanthochromogenes TaxID=67384 RepID=UPI003418460E